MLKTCFLLIILLWLTPLLPAQEQTLLIYDVHDLLVAEDPTDEDPMEREQRGAEQTQALASVIRSFIQPALVENLEEIKALGIDTLVVQARPEQHDWIRTFLEVQRQAGDCYFFLEVSFYASSGEAYQEHAPDPGSSKPMTLTAEKIEVKLNELNQAEGVNLITAPRMLIRNNQEGTVMLANQITLLTGYEVHENVEPIGARVIDPVVEIAEEGFTFTGRATLLQENRIGLTLKTRYQSIPRPLPRVETEYGLVTKPELRTVAMETCFILEDGTSMIQTLPGKEKGDVHHLLQLTIKKTLSSELSDLDLGK